MRKRKNEEILLEQSRIGPIHPLMRGLIVCGLLVVIGLSIGSVIRYALYQPARAANPANSVRVSPTRQPVAIRYSPPTGMPLADDVRLAVSANSGEIHLNTSGLFRPLGIQGSEIAASGGSLAYLRGNQLYLYREGTEKHVAIPGFARLLAWSADGRWLAVVGREADSETVYRVDTRSLQAVPLLAVPQISGPPVSDPATGHILIAQPTADGKTRLYAVDPDHPTKHKDIATVAYRVQWITYHPSATAIAFDDSDTGGIYLLYPATGKIEPLPLVPGARRPEFSPDGTQLAFLDDYGQLYVYSFVDSTTRIAPFSRVTAADWLE